MAHLAISETENRTLYGNGWLFFTKGRIKIEYNENREFLLSIFFYFFKFVIRLMYLQTEIPKSEDINYLQFKFYL